MKLVICKALENKNHLKISKWIISFEITNCIYATYTIEKQLLSAFHELSTNKI